MTQREVEEAIEDALGKYANSPSNPTGGTGYYDAGADKPFRVLFSDSVACESFTTLEEAVEAACEYADGMDAEE